MKLIAKSLTILLAAVCGLCVGFAWRSHRAAALAGSETSAAIASATTNQNGSTAKHRPAAPARDDSPLVTRLEKNLALSSGVTRWLYWLEAIEKASPSDFPRLARLAKNNPAAMRFIAARWAASAPRQMFDYLANTTELGEAGWDLKDTLLREWIKSDREAVIAALNERPGVVGQASLRNQVAEMIIRTDPERGIRLFDEWGIHSYIPRMTGVIPWAAKDPAHAAQFTLDHPLGYPSQEIMQTIGKEWAKTDPAAALAFAAPHPGELSSHLAKEALAGWTAKDLTAAGAWLASADPALRNQLTPALVEAWAKQDSSSAITWCQQNLTGNNLSQAVAGVLKGVADKDLLAARELVSNMAPSSERAAAAGAIAKKLFPDTFSDSKLKPESIQWLGTLDPESINRVLEEAQWSWASNDPKSMADFLTANANASTATSTYAHVARELIRKDPVAALAWAAQQRPERALAVGGDAFGEWTSVQPDLAVKWLGDLPATDPRREVFLKNAIRSLAWSRNTTQLGVFSSLDPAVARDTLTHMDLTPDRRNELLAALQN